MPLILICNILKSLGLEVVGLGVGSLSVEEEEWDGVEREWEEWDGEEEVEEEEGGDE